MSDTTQAAERLRFESWISGPPLSRCIARFGVAWPGQYTDPSVDLCWLAWQEALTHADDGEPITEEHWQQRANDMGFIAIDDSHWLHWSKEIGLTLDGPIEAMPLPHITTRGQLRRLIEVLKCD